MEENNTTQAGGNYVPSRLESVKGRFSGLPWYLWLFIVVALITSFLIALYYLSPGFKNFVQKNPATPSPTPKVFWTPSPIPILSGTQKYTIGGGDQGFPLITSLVLDPQDPVVGKPQTISVSANNKTPIKEVIVVLHLDDNKDFEYTLDFKEGTNTNGTWSKTITFPYSYNTAYRATVKARNEGGLGNMTTITIR